VAGRQPFQGALRIHFAAVSRPSRPEREKAEIRLLFSAPLIGPPKLCWPALWGEVRLPRTFRYAKGLKTCLPWSGTGCGGLC